MGLPALRLGDINAGGGVLIMGAMTVLINGRPAARIGDLNTPHPPKHPPNPLVIGVPTIIVEGRPASHLMHIEALGHPYIIGSTNVLYGG